MERIVMEGTPLTLEERIERQANEIRAKEQQIEAQQQQIEQLKDRNITYVNENANQAKEIERLNEVIDDFKYEAECDFDHIAALIADKDEQAGRIMRMEDGLEKAKQIFRNIEIITACPETGNERNAMQMAIDGHRLMVALLGGKEE